MGMRRTGSVMTPLCFEEWRSSIHSICGRYNVEGAVPPQFIGWVTPTRIFGFDAVNIACNAERVERRHRDVRADGRDNYFAVFQIGGASTMVQNEHATLLSCGDIALVDSTRPMTCSGIGDSGVWLLLNLPREQVEAHLGRQPEGGQTSIGRKIAGRSLFQMVSDTVGGLDDSSEADDPHMTLAVYDLIGALFAPRDTAATTYSHKNYQRACQIIRDGFTDCELTPGKVAQEAGFSLRYLQKLFTAHGTTCTRFVQSVRLGHAERMIRRRSLLRTGQSIGDIAYQSGFNDYNHFRRLFRDRFGSTPIEHRSHE